MGHLGLPHFDLQESPRLNGKKNMVSGSVFPLDQPIEHEFGSCFQQLAVAGLL